MRPLEGTRARGTSKSNNVILKPTVVCQARSQYKLITSADPHFHQVYSHCTGFHRSSWYYRRSWPSREVPSPPATTRYFVPVPFTLYGICLSVCLSDCFCLSLSHETTTEPISRKSCTKPVYIAWNNKTAVKTCSMIQDKKSF